MHLLSWLLFFFASRGLCRQEAQCTRVKSFLGPHANRTLTAQEQNFLYDPVEALHLYLFVSTEYQRTLEALSEDLWSHVTDAGTQNLKLTSRCHPICRAIEWQVRPFLQTHLSASCAQRILEVIYSSRDIASIAPAKRMRPLNNIATRTIQGVYKSKVPSLWAHDITGRGQILAIGDTALNYRSCYFSDEDAEVAFYPKYNFTHRKIVTYVGCPAAPGKRHAGTSSSHGTHVCCSALGKAVGPEASAFNGIAHGAKLYFNALSCSDGGGLTLPLDLAEYLAPQLASGAFISSNSWGSQHSPSAYPFDDRQVDRFLYDNEEFLAIFAAGNDPSAGILSPGTSKNALTVSAHYNSLVDEHRRSVSPRAAAGPTYDGRIKPDILAPGEYVTSAASASDCARPVCDLGAKIGTSMATPFVAGSAALVRQYFMEGFYPSGKRRRRDAMTPTGALIKATLIHCGKSFERKPNVREGWGRLEDVGKMLYFAEKGAASSLFVSDRAAISDREETILSFSADASKQGAHPSFIRATLVWMDPPLATPGASSSIIYDLDLVLSFPDGTLHYANGLERFDKENNVEQITHDLQQASGRVRFQVRIYGARVRWRGTASTQQYALVASAPGLRREKGNKGYSCPRNCTQRGICTSNGQCACRDPFHHVDCSAA